jgi:prolyl oligopeptidase
MSAARLCPCRLRDMGCESRRDDRVHRGHARKMAAKLQAMGYEAYFYEPAAGGHGYGKDNKERASFTALGYNFLRRAIGWSE